MKDMGDTTIPGNATRHKGAFAIRASGLTLFNTTSAGIDQGIGTVASNGALIITPRGATTHTLTAPESAGPAVAKTAVTVIPFTPIPTSDEFNSATLDPSWSFINPKNDSSYSLTSTAGHLQLSTPGTVAHQCWGSKDPAVTCVRMTRPAANADAVYQTRLSGSALTTGFMKYGIFLQQDSANFMRFEFASLSASKIVAQGWNISNGNGGNTIAGPAVTLQAYNYLRLTKTGSKFRLEYSGDGVTWLLAGEILVPGFTVNQAGLFISNSGNTPPVTASFDYWRVTVQSPNDTVAPAVPTGITASAASANRVNLSWQASTDDTAVTGYNIYRNGAFIGTAITTSYSDTSLAPATAYAYSVAAFDAAGNVSGQSPGTTATTAPTSNVSPMQLKVLVWNVQQCETTEGVCDVNKQAQAMAQSNADFMLFAEVLEANIPQYISALNQALPGVTWYQHFGRICPLATCNGGVGQGQLLLSKIQPSSTSIKYFSGADRSAEAMVFNNLNGKRVALVVTHLASNGWDAEDASPLRASEMDEMKIWARSLAPLQILAGDYNTSPVRMYNGEPEINRIILDGYADAWQQSMNQGTASGYSDNPTGSDIRTLRARIDYLFYSSDPALSVLSATVPDSRDLTNTNVAYIVDTPDDKAVKPSDHNKLEVVLSIAGGVPPSVNSFVASPASISLGQSSTLSWTTSNASTVAIDQGIGSVASSGSVTVSPTSTTTYTLTATNSQGSTTATAQVTVGQAPAITSLAPVSGPEAGGTVVVISGTGFAQGATVKFDTINSTSVTVNSATSINATAPGHAVGSVSVSVTNPNSQTGVKSNAFTYVASPPSAPANLTAVASTTANQVTLSWTDTSSNETTFKIERCSGTTCSNFVQVNMVGANVTSFTNTGLARNTTYRYRVRAFNSSGNSAYSNIVTIKTRP
jgi:endonuclease/exonuclease/phosphatase family metal-dependent hydrolase